MANLRFQNALTRTAQKVPPIWFMRQAGRYHKHYQNIRKDHSFEKMCKNPDLAAQVALGPVEDFDFDVAILFSDILFPLEALGMGLQYTDHGPRLGFSLTPDNFKFLKEASAGTFMRFQKEALQNTRALLPMDKSLIGFIGGPWTLFVYAVEGSHSGSLTLSKSYLPLFPKFLEKMLPFLQENVLLQLAGGAEAVMIFDTAAGELSPWEFQKWVQPALQTLCETAKGKVGYYSKQTQASYFNEDFRRYPWAGLGFDHHWNLAETFQISSQGFVQGNFDQSLLFMDTAYFSESLGAYLQKMKELPLDARAGWVCGLGHGVLPKTPEAHVRRFVETARKVLS